MGQSHARSRARRFDLTLPGNVPQTDLERLQVAVSHDGRQIVVASSTPATGQALWARNYTDGQWRLIPGSHGGHRPFLSQDGQWIGFHRSSSIYKRRFGEGEAIRLGTSTNWYGASFVEDGSVVWASAWNAALNYAPPSGGLPNDLTTLHPDKSDFAHLSPAVINGTRWVVFTSWRGNEDADIDAIHLDTKQRHPVITNATTPRVAKTPRGMYLLFERASTVFAAPLDPATAKLTAREAPIADGVLTDGTRFASYFDATDEGTLVYIPGGAFSEENRLSYVNPDGSTTPFNDDRLAFAEPKFALDGSKMCVSIKGKVYKALVYDLKRNTREMIQLGFDVTGSEVMPDGSGLLLTVNRDGGYGVDYYSLATGRIVRRIVEPGPDYPSDLSVSPDGKFMVYTCSAVAGSPRDIWIVDLAEGAKPRQMVKTPYTDQHGAVSPNGKWVAFTSEMSGRAEVHIVGVPDGQPIRQITYSGGTEPAWAPDGQSLYYIADGVLMKVSMSDDGRVTSPPAVVYDKPFGQSDNIARNMTVAPDGRPMIVEPSERRPQITNLQVITNWWTLLPK